MSTLKVGAIQSTTGNAAMTVANTGVITAPNAIIAPGSVLQVQYTQYTGTFSQAVNADTNTIIGSSALSVSITPKSTSSIIKIDAHIFHEWANSGSPHNSVWFFYRDSTKLAHAQVGTALCGITNTLISYSTDGSSTPEIANYTYFDTPSTTSAITYKVGTINNASTTVFVNKNNSSSTTNEYERGISFISATEIGG